MRPENQRMAAFLRRNGIDATPKYLAAGSRKGTWRLYAKGVPWTDTLAQKLNALGFTDYNNAPLGPLSGNGGVFSVFVRGHRECLSTAEDYEAGRPGVYILYPPERRTV